ncbi:MAG: SUF system NifU family Fe-S cluster assembly protein [Puniceicoccaceae bacterium]|nr:SUF system NifU family Fe-S cluster assembly protein [Puniceicoccaceae bacterium]|tara:strand:- start:2247 stop:2711 length:465 start_codon:yes stop_codon:yes gene_type:complete
MKEADLKSLYQSVLIEHSKAPLHYGKLASHTHVAEGFNSICGDSITLYLKVGEGLIQAAQFESASCSICTASASMMLERIHKLSLRELIPVFTAFDQILEPSGTIDSENLGKDLLAFEGLREFPARINCAHLPWKTLSKALNLDVPFSEPVKGS